MKTIVIALGGNAILQSSQKGTSEEQMNNVKKATKNIVRLIKEGYNVVVTHGNGPQVGNILLQNIAGKDKVPAMPLDICGSESQGLIGYMIQQNIKNELKLIGIEKPVLTVLTQVVVDKNDEAFENPTKPVGPFYTKEFAEEGINKGEHWIEDSGRGWRKVVASPKPVRIVEIESIRTLVNSGAVVISVGGGGIPVIENSKMLQGIEAVIDKDLSSSLLAELLNADILVIATDVDKVAINFGKTNQKNLDVITIAEAQKYKDEGQFSKSSIGPKVDAAVNFARSGGNSIITALDNLYNAVVKESGTRFIS